jgi:thiamine-monophosphate kinase
VHAAIDLCDGLSLDLARLLAASGLGAEIHAEQIPLSPDAWKLAADQEGLPLPELGDHFPPAGLRRRAWDHALSDGEDFELLLAVDPASAAVLVREQPLAAGLTDIGVCLDGPGQWLISADGSRQPLVARGYVHRLD